MVTQEQKSSQVELCVLRERIELAHFEKGLGKSSGDEPVRIFPTPLVAGMRDVFYTP